MCPNVSTTPITAMGWEQCFPISVVQLKGKHCRKPHCRNGVVDMFGQGPWSLCRHYLQNEWTLNARLFQYQLDSPFEMWFRYRLQYRLKVSANLGFSIGPKPKKWFRSYSNSNQVEGGCRFFPPHYFWHPQIVWPSAMPAICTYVVFL